MDRTTPNQQNKNCLVEILRRHVSSLEDRTYRTGMSFSGVNEREELLEMCYTSKFYNMKLRPSMSTWLTGVFKHIAEWRKFPASAVCRDGGIRLKPHQKAAWTTNVIKSLAVSRRNMGILDDEVHIKDSSDLGSLFRPACLHLTHLLRNSDVVFFVLRVPYPKEVQNIVLVLLDCRSRKFRLFDPKDLVCDRGRLQRRAYIKKTLKDLVSFVADAADEPRYACFVIMTSGYFCADAIHGGKGFQYNDHTENDSGLILREELRVLRFLGTIQSEVKFLYVFCLSKYGVGSRRDRFCCH